MTNINFYVLSISTIARIYYSSYIKYPSVSRYIIINIRIIISFLCKKIRLIYKFTIPR